jgi:quinol monooxygenase YgiN
MAELYVVAILTAKADQADAVRALLLDAVPAFRAEDGCVGYTLHEDEKRAGRFITYEVWRDDAALAAHMTATTMTATAPKLADLLEREMELYPLDTLLQL